VVKSKTPIGEKSYRRLTSMGKSSRDIINSLYSPLDAMNRFINLTLQNIEEDSQSRQFLLETKTGLKRVSVLLKKLDTYADKIEEEFNEIYRKPR